MGSSVGGEAFLMLEKEQVAQVHVMLTTEFDDVCSGVCVCVCVSVFVCGQMVCLV